MYFALYTVAKLICNIAINTSYDTANISYIAIALWSELSWLSLF